MNSCWTYSPRRLWLLPIGLCFGLIAALVPPSAADELAELRGDLPSVTEAADRLLELEHERDVALAAGETAETQLQAALQRRDALGEELTRLATEIEALRTSTRGLALSSFVGGGTGATAKFLLEVQGASELSRRRQLLSAIAHPIEQNSDRLQELEEQANSSLLALVDEIATLREAIIENVSVVADIEARLDEARQVLVTAEAWDRAEVAISSSRYPHAPLSAWAALRYCESSGDYSAISPSGRYRGAYQFDLPTWQSVGGTGDPALAPAGEQDARAQELYARRGPNPWPVCGSHLR